MRRGGGVLASLSRLGRWLLLTALVGAAGGVLCRHLVLTHLDERIREGVEDLFAAHYRDLVVQIDAARRVEGKGIEVRGFSLRSRTADASDQLVYVDELFLACRTELRQLLSGTVHLQRLTLRRMKLRATCHDGSWNVAHLFPLPEFGGSVPRIDIENSTIELRDVGRTTGEVGFCVKSTSVWTRILTRSRGRRGNSPDHFWGTISSVCDFKDIWIRKRWIGRSGARWTLWKCPRTCSGRCRRMWGNTCPF
jgi:hypothetical protein